MIDKRDLWNAVMVANGHSPVMVDYGDDYGPRVSFMAFSSHDAANHHTAKLGHNGPRCATCGVGWCWHCHEDPSQVVTRCKGKTIPLGPPDAAVNGGDA